MATIRLTVKGLYELQDALQSSKQVQAAVLPKEALVTTKLVVAWAKGLDGQEHFLVIWRDAESWRKAKSNLLTDVLEEEVEKSEEYADHTQRAAEEEWGVEKL